MKCLRIFFINVVFNNRVNLGFQVVVFKDCYGIFNADCNKKGMYINFCGLIHEILYAIALHSLLGAPHKVGLLFKSLLKVKQTSMDYLDTVITFEAMVVEVEVNSQIVSILIVYRPPPSSANDLSTSLFMNEFSSLLESYIIKTGSFLIAGDFNYHVDDTSDAVAANVLGLLESFDLQQHVHSYTHRAGHTLDLVISRSAESILNVTSVDDSSMISDHYTVCADLQFVKPSWERKRIRARKLKAVDIEQFKKDIELSPLLSDSSSDLQEPLHLYNSELSSILDKHAPLKSRMVTIRPAAPWFSEEIKLERIGRRFERKWRRSGLPEDRIRFIEQNRIVNQLLFSARSQYYTKLIDENCLNQRKLFGIVSKLLHRNPAPFYPSCYSAVDLVNNFIGFFADKITTIRYELDSNPKQSIHIFEEASAATTKLNRFTCPPLSTLLKILLPLASKCCELDPVPSSILLDCLDLLGPVIWKIVNLSLETSFMPTELKQAVIRPLLKKPGLDHQHYRNFRPISNLTFLSKAIEKAVALQLVDYIDSNGLCEVFQSPYRANHSTETALIRVYNDIALSIDSRKSVILVLLDLSAAFDTVDHFFLLSRLSACFGIVTMH